MSRPADRLPRTLEVRLHGRLVGYLTNLPDDTTVFAFDTAYAADESRPTLSLSFSDAQGNIDESAVHRVRRLAPAYFSNLLPEGGLRNILAEKLHVSADRDFPLLADLGGDLPGAVTLGAIDPVDPPPGDALVFSLPGVQLKLSALLGENDALTIPIRGEGGDWIVKVGTGKYDGLVENEFTMLEFARSVRIEVPRTMLVDPSDIRGLPAEFQAHGPALAIERYDRAPDGLRVHAEDFNQVFGQFPHDKYQNQTYGDIAKKLYQSAGQTEAFEFVRRAIFTAAIGNGDAHLKNWSVIYRDGRTPTLAPAYDYVSTLPYPVDHSLALSFGESKAADGFDSHRLRRFARSADLPLRLVEKAAAEIAGQMIEVWPTLDIRMRAEHVAPLATHLKRIALEVSPRSIRIEGPTL